MSEEFVESEIKPTADGGYFSWKFLWNKIAKEKERYRWYLENWYSYIRTFLTSCSLSFLSSISPFSAMAGPEQITEEADYK